MGAKVWADPLLVADAELVARETMRRARANVDFLLDVLPAAGYRFSGFRGPAFVPPEPDVHEHLREIEAGAGPGPAVVAGLVGRGRRGRPEPGCTVKY